MRFASVSLPSLVLVLAIIGSGCPAEEETQTTGDDEGTSAATDGGTSAPTDGGTADDGVSTVPTTSATASETDTTATTATDDGATDNADSGTGGTLTCMDNSECRTFSDCCSCEAVHVDQELPPTCDAACDRTVCQLWHTEAICAHTCALQLVDCDPSLIMCADDPPVCEDGFQAAIVDRCWTQQCVPVELCTPY